MSEIRAIEIHAEILRIASRQDHTFDVTFKVPEDCIEQTQQLIAHMLDEVRMVIEFNYLDSQEMENGTARRARKTKKG